ncbi:MAG TPA: hypothetical protein VGD71_21715, partial [Kribbella sp.]
MEFLQFGDVGEVRYGQRRSVVAQGVADGGLVAAGAQEDPDSGGVNGEIAQFVVDHGHVEAELTGVGRLKLADLQLHDHVGECLGVKEEQVHRELVAVDVEGDLTAEECEAATELGQG